MFLATPFCNNLLLATNIAEIYLTIDEIYYVVDHVFKKYPHKHDGNILTKTKTSFRNL
jgi:HrpA-like RNA helicase